MRKKKENESHENENSYFCGEGTSEQRYYSHHSRHVQSGCRECGNSAYPDCKDGCPLFDY